MTKKILIITGESSGDHHAAEVVNALKSRSGNFVFSGMAGPKMRAAGVNELVKAEDMAIMGFVDVFTHITVIYQAYQTIKKFMKTEKPDLIILIDYAGFNLRVAKLAKKLGIKVLYYISPKVWAWKQGRVKHIKATVDLMAVIFPFEVGFYQQFGVPVRYVGSPIAETAKSDYSLLQAREKLNLPADKKIVVLLPGSRRMEIKCMLPLMLEVAQSLKNKFPDIQFVLPIANTLKDDKIKQIIQEYSVDVKLVRDATYTAIRSADAAICTSGTVTLETALLGTPLVVVYRGGEISAQIVKRLIKVDKIGLCNIVAEKFIAKEFVQWDAKPELIFEEVNRLLTDVDYRNNMKQAFDELHKTLGSERASENVADLVVEMV